VLDADIFSTHTAYVHKYLRRRAKKEAVESGENLTIDLSSLWIRVLAPFPLTQLYCADNAHKYAIPQ